MKIVISSGWAKSRFTVFVWKRHAGYCYNSTNISSMFHILNTFALNIFIQNDLLNISYQYTALCQAMRLALKRIVMCRQSTGSDMRNRYVKETTQERRVGLLRKPQTESEDPKVPTQFCTSQEVTQQCVCLCKGIVIRIGTGIVNLACSLGARHSATRSTHPTSCSLPINILKYDYYHPTLYLRWIKAPQKNNFIPHEPFLGVILEDVFYQNEEVNLDKSRKQGI